MSLKTRKLLSLSIVLSTGLMAACSDSSDSGLDTNSGSQVTAAETTVVDNFDTEVGNSQNQANTDTTPAPVANTESTDTTTNTQANVVNNDSNNETVVIAPQVTAPEVTAPEVTAPEVTVPEVTAPEVTTPEVTAPEVTTPEVTAPEVTAPEVTAPEVTAPESNEPEETAAPAPINPPPENASTGLATARFTGNDTSGNTDDSPTATETASLIGPFLKNVDLPAGPPTVPTGLTMLLAGEDYVEMSWIPSSDDQSVEAYEIYRDGALVYTIRGDTGDPDYRLWITTSYTDCDYTRYNCRNNPIVKGSSYSYQIAAVDNEGARSELSEPVVFQLAQASTDGPDLSGYVQVFDDEFDGATLDRNLWKTSLPWGPNRIVNKEEQYFVNLFGSDPLPVDPYVMTGSTLQITGTRTPADLLERANNQPYLSGVISTQDNFKLTYGYIEMRAKVVSGQGFLSAFFLFNQDFEKNKPEIDIIEYIGSAPDKAFQTYHYRDSNRFRWEDGESHSTPTMEATGVDFSADFHNYSVLWEEELIIWYIDGVEVQRLEGPRVSDEPMNIIAQLVIGSEWIGTPDASTLPKVMEIDYIKAWQKQ